jgi:hypothetical protein
MIVRRIAWTLIALLCATALIACEPEPTGPRAWIDFPRDGASIPVGAPVTVLSHVFAPEGVAEVLLSVNGVAYRRSPPSAAGNFAQASHEWLPDREGDFVLEVTAFSTKGEASAPARARVKVRGKATPTPVSPTPVTPRIPAPVTTVPPLTAPPTTVAPSVRADLAIVSVDAVVVGYKGDIALCRPRVVYRNLGTIPVPNDYVLQLIVNSTPQMTMTRGAGFGVGGTSEAIFDYTFEGALSIGVTLDSTNTVVESDETNNTLTRILRCNGTATPATPTLTPTRTPTIPPPVGCVGTPNIPFFTVSPTAIYQGQSATLSWGAVTNADSVSIEPGIGGVASPGSRVVAPMNTTTYTLTARCGATTVTRQVTIIVTHPPTPTFTPTTKPLDTQAPPAPQLVSPSGTLSCRASVTLDWNAVSDPSGIKTYYVKLERQVTPGNWQSAGGWTTSSTAQTVSVQCGGIYRWQVRAEDNAGNEGPWSGFMNFSINLP